MQRVADLMQVGGANAAMAFRGAFRIPSSMLGPSAN
jgi:hypothetical protein